MIRFVYFKFLVALVLLSAPIARAQFSSDSTFGVGAGLAKLFGNSSGFTARAEVRVLDTNRQETVRTPMGFEFLPGKMRMEIDMAQMKGKSITPGAVAGFKQAGLDRVINIVRLDKETIHVVFPGARGYLNMELSGADAEAAGKKLQLSKTPAGNEMVDGHPCAKNQVVLKSAKGATLLEATTWNASDLKDFPLRIAVQAKETTIIDFTQVRMARPDAARFNPPANFVRFPGPDSLMLYAAERQRGLLKPAAAPAKTDAARKPVTAQKPATAPKPDAVKKTTTSSSTVKK